MERRVTVHYVSLDHQLAAFGLRRVEITPDGNCLFRAFSHQFTGTEENHEVFREDAINYMRENIELIEPFVTDDESVEDIIRRLEVRNSYGDYFSILALSFVHNCAFVIHELNIPLKIIGADKSQSSSYRKEIHVAYLNRIHYDSVVFIDREDHERGSVSIQPDLETKSAYIGQIFETLENVPKHDQTLQQQIIKMRTKKLVIIAKKNTMKGSNTKESKTSDDKDEGDNDDTMTNAETSKEVVLGSGKTDNHLKNLQKRGRRSQRGHSNAASRSLRNVGRQPGNHMGRGRGRPRGSSKAASRSLRNVGRQMGNHKTAEQGNSRNISQDAPSSSAINEMDSMDEYLPNSSSDASPIDTDEEKKASQATKKRRQIKKKGKGVQKTTEEEENDAPNQIRFELGERSRRFPCPFCDAVEFDSSLVCEHLKIKHKLIEINLNVDENTIIDNNLDGKPYDYYCFICEKGFYSMEAISLHVQNDH